MTGKATARLLLSLYLGFHAFNAQAQYVPKSQHFEDETIHGGTYEARDSISAVNAEVATGASVSFRAGQRIRLLPGFRASAGSRFRAAIEPVEELALTCPLPGGALADLPPRGVNTRFLDDLFASEDFTHPSLSINGLLA